MTGIEPATSWSQTTRPTRLGYIPKREQYFPSAPLLSLAQNSAEAGRDWPPLRRLPIRQPRAFGADPGIEPGRDPYGSARRICYGFLQTADLPHPHKRCAAFSRRHDLQEWFPLDSSMFPARHPLSLRIRGQGPLSYAATASPFSAHCRAPHVRPE